MEINRHTTDSSGFDFMANSGRVEKDRDTFGLLAAVIIVVLLTAFQYWGWY